MLHKDWRRWLVLQPQRRRRALPAPNGVAAPRRFSPALERLEHRELLAIAAGDLIYYRSSPFYGDAAPRIPAQIGLIGRATGQAQVLLTEDRSSAPDTGALAVNSAGDVFFASWAAAGQNSSYVYNDATIYRRDHASGNVTAVGMLPAVTPPAADMLAAYHPAPDQLVVAPDGDLIYYRSSPFYGDAAPRIPAQIGLIGRATGQAQVLVTEDRSSAPDTGALAVNSAGDVFFASWAAAGQNSSYVYNDATIYRRDHASGNVTAVGMLPAVTPPAADMLAAYHPAPDQLVVAPDGDLIYYRSSPFYGDAAPRIPAQIGLIGRATGQAQVLLTEDRSSAPDTGALAVNSAGDVFFASWAAAGQNSSYVYNDATIYRRDHASGNVTAVGMLPAVTPPAADMLAAYHPAPDQLVVVPEPAVAPTATFANAGAVAEGSPGKVSFTKPYDPSAADTAAGFHYAYDYDNDGTFDFGDGTYAGSETATHVTVPTKYFDDGPDRVTIRGRITDQTGKFTDYKTTITVNSAAPTATFGNTGPVVEGNPVTIAFTKPTDPSAADRKAGFRYSYDVNGDGKFDITDSTSASTKLTNLKPGTYTVKGRIKDKDGAYRDYSTQVVVDDAALTATGKTVKAAAGKGFSATLATFTDGNTHTTAADYHALIRWGDDKSSAGTITLASGHFTVTGKHTYRVGGKYDVSVTITDSDISKAVALSTAKVAAATLKGTGKHATTGVKVAFDGLVATLVDADKLMKPTDYKVTIQWGDGKHSTGVVTKTAAGAFAIAGKHTYLKSGTFRVEITVKRPGGTDLTVIAQVVVKVF